MEREGERMFLEALDQLQLAAKNLDEVCKLLLGSIEEITPFIIEQQNRLQSHLPSFRASYYPGAN